MSKPGSHFQPIRGLSTGSPRLVRPMRRRATRSTTEVAAAVSPANPHLCRAGLCRLLLEPRRGHQVRSRGPVPPTPSDAQPPQADRAGPGYGVSVLPLEEQRAVGVKVGEGPTGSARGGACAPARRHCEFCCRTDDASWTRVPRPRRGLTGAMASVLQRVAVRRKGALR